MKKRNIKNNLHLKKTTISTLSEKAVKGGITTSAIYTSRFADLCYGAHTSFILVCAYACAPDDY
ncbi:hypothetical protein [uncultured Kordia sp.]|uniref:hypothetical protein n=1 Tax=uncultured Kordia sp. TaxID=507699 RepID=UPI002614D835|nr:hypothetical protein [uncultured Kordia sp.]